ncbi:MAG: WGR domain-containing protein [Chloroflexota bacterium]
MQFRVLHEINRLSSPGAAFFLRLKTMQIADILLDNGSQTDNPAPSNLDQHLPISPFLVEFKKKKKKTLKNKKEMKAVLLHRINPDKNEKRFYWIQIGPSLVDDWAVIRIWGRIGQNQTVLVTPCPDEATALKLGQRLLRKRLKRSYHIQKGTLDDETVGHHAARSTQSQS